MGHGAGVLFRALEPSAGVPANADRLQFTPDGQREMGRRYAAQMLKVLGY